MCRQSIIVIIFSILWAHFFVMPKQKKTGRLRAQEYAREFGFYRADGAILFCKLCSTVDSQQVC